MPMFSAIPALKLELGKRPSGTDDIDHLSADRTGLAGGKVAVITLLEVDADLLSCFKLCKNLRRLIHQGGLEFI